VKKIICFVTLLATEFVFAQNHPPLFYPPKLKGISAGREIRINLNAIDPEGKNIRYGTEKLPSRAYLNESTGLFSWIPSSSQTGSHIIDFTATDSDGYSVTKQTEIRVFQEKQWYPVNVPCYEDNLNDISFIDDTTGWIVGNNGLVLKTTNGGINWIQIDFHDTTDYHYVEFYDDKSGWILGERGRIHYTYDGGENWEIQTTLVNTALRSGHFVKPYEGWVVGERKTILHTLNGGYSWNIQSSMAGETPTGRLQDVFFINNTMGWIAGENAGLFKTTNGGTDWNSVNLGYSETSNVNFYSLFFTDPDNGFVAGSKRIGGGIYGPIILDGLLLRTTNGGTNWQEVKVSRTTIIGTIKKIEFINKNEGWLITVTGKVCNTTDGGITWNIKNSLDRNYLTGLHVSASGKLWACSGYGNILYSWNNGTDWSLQNDNSLPDLKSVFFFGNSTGWMCGEFGTLIKTTDGGITWQSQNAEAETDMKKVMFIDPFNGFMIDRSNNFFYTYNGGITWERKTISSGSMLYDFDFYMYLGWAVTNNGEVYITYDGGRNWRNITTMQNYSLYGVHYAPGRTLWSTGRKGLILKSTDNGYTWINKSLTTDDVFSKVRFTDSDTGWILNWREQILKTTDAGETWDNMNIPAHCTPLDFYFTDSGHGWVIGEKGTILSTTNGGTTWETEEYYTGLDLNAIHFSDDAGWIVGDNGVIFKYDLHKATDIHSRVNTITSLNLNQNYPNPFNQQTAISYSVPVMSRVRIDIYNTLGQTVVVPLNEVKQPGEYRIVWNGRDSRGNDLPTGVYFYRIQAGDFSDVKKMVLLR